MDITPVAIFLALIAIDLLWLSMRQQYHDTLFYSIQKSKLQVNYLAAFLVYVVLAGSLYVGAVLDASSLQNAGLRGALIGFILYVFYDLTNMATLTNYTWEMVFTDSIWGGIVSGLACLLGYWIMRRV